MTDLILQYNWNNYEYLMCVGGIDESVSTIKFHIMQTKMLLLLFMVCSMLQRSNERAIQYAIC